MTATRVRHTSIVCASVKDGATPELRPGRWVLPWRDVERRLTYSDGKLAPLGRAYLDVTGRSLPHTPPAVWRASRSGRLFTRMRRDGIRFLSTRCGALNSYGLTYVERYGPICPFNCVYDPYDGLKGMTYAATPIPGFPGFS